MRRFLWVITILTLALARGAHADSPRPSQDVAEEGQTPAERTVAADPDVTVTLCVGTGDVVVRGWERREVRARAHVARVELRRQANPPNVPGPPPPPHRKNVPNAPQSPSYPNPPRPPSPANAPGPPAGAPSAPRPVRAVEVLMSDSDD